MPTCEYDKLYGQHARCPNEAYASIGIKGDTGQITVNICEYHLGILQSMFPTQETDHARAQREGMEE